MSLRHVACVALVLSLGMPFAWSQPAAPAKAQIGVLSGLPRPEGFAVEDQRASEMKTGTPFKQTYKAPFSFRPPRPVAKFERNVGDEELSVLAIDLFAEKLVEHYGDRLKGKRLVVREFTYTVEQILEENQATMLVPVDAGTLVFAIAFEAAMSKKRGSGVKVTLALKLDAELDGRRLEFAESGMDLIQEGTPQRITRFAVEKFIYRFDAAGGMDQK